MVMWHVTCKWPRARPTSLYRHVYKVGSAHLPFYKKSIKIWPTYTYIRSTISRAWVLGHSTGSHILVTLLRFVYRVTRMSSQKFHQVPQGYRVIMLWVQGNQNVITSWYGLVALLAPHCYNSHPLLTTYRIRYKVYISLNNEVNTLEYFNLAVIVR